MSKKLFFVVHMWLVIWLFLFFIMAIFTYAQAPTTVAPLNITGVATGCDNVSIPCTYTDLNVPPGPHFYFVVAANTNNYSTPSNRVDVIVPAGIHSVTLKWNPSTTTSPVPTYFIYRGAPPTALTGVAN